MKTFSIAMIEPSRPVNVGHMARLAKNFGVQRLILVNPSVDLKAARVFSAHGSDALLAAESMSWEELTAGFDLLVGTTAMRALKSSNLLRAGVTPEELAKRLRGFTGRVCLIFGREDKGLRNEELRECDVVVTIGTGTNYRTLNIGHAAAIILYEVSRGGSFQRRRVSERAKRMLVSDYAAKLAVASGYPSYKIPLVQRSLHQVLGRGGASSREISLIMGLLRKALLALE